MTREEIKQLGRDAAPLANFRSVRIIGTSLAFAFLAVVVVACSFLVSASPASHGFFFLLPMWRWVLLCLPLLPLLLFFGFLSLFFT